MAETSWAAACVLLPGWAVLLHDPFPYSTHVRLSLLSPLFHKPAICGNYVAGSVAGLGQRRGFVLQLHYTAL